MTNDLFPSILLFCMEGVFTVHGCLLALCLLLMLALIVPLTIAFFGLLITEQPFLFVLTMIAIVGCIVVVAYFKSNRQITIRKILEEKGVNEADDFDWTHCKYCGQSIKQTARRCPFCGAKNK